MRGMTQMFTEPERNTRRVPLAAIIVAAVVVPIVAVLLSFSGRRHAIPAGRAGAATVGSAYAPQLVLSDVAMSESTSFSGGKETFVDGRITNRGAATVMGATAEVAFPADGGLKPQIETVPVTLIRTRQPYIDIEALSVEPLAPGASREFRLTFDDIRPDWNQGTPVIRVTGVALK